MGWGLAVAGIAAAGASAYGASQVKAPGAAAPIDIGDVTRSSIRANNQVAPEIEALIRRSDAFSSEQNLKLLERAIPGYGKLSAKLSGIAESNLENPYKLPKEFEDNLSRVAAERGIATGVRGEASNFSLLRDIGVNSLEYGRQQIGQAQEIMSMLAGLAKVNPLSPLSFYATPSAGLAAASGNQSLQQSVLNANAAASNAQATGYAGAASQAFGTIGGYYANKYKPTDGGGGTPGTKGTPSTPSTTTKP